MGSGLLATLSSRFTSFMEVVESRWAVNRGDLDCVASFSFSFCSSGIDTPLTPDCGLLSDFSVALLEEDELRCVKDLDLSICGASVFPSSFSSALSVASSKVSCRRCIVSPLHRALGTDPHARLDPNCTHVFTIRDIGIGIASCSRRLRVCIDCYFRHPVEYLSCVGRVLAVREEIRSWLMPSNLEAGARSALISYSPLL